MELIPPLGDGKVIDSSPASVHTDPNSECLRPTIPGLEKLRNGVSMQENTMLFRIVNYARQHFPYSTKFTNYFCTFFPQFCIPHGVKMLSLSPIGSMHDFTNVFFVENL